MIEQLRVPGATLHVERRGSGPTLLFVVGGSGDPDTFTPAAEHLAGDFTVVAWARRGFDRSPLDGPVPDGDGRVAADVADAAALIEHAGNGPAYVLGSSSGAIVTLELVARHPELVRLAIPHEPPLLALLDDPQGWRDRFAEVVAVREREGLMPAMRSFLDAVGMEPPPSDGPPPRDVLARIELNAGFWMDHEVPTYPSYPVDLDALDRSKVTPGGGRESRDAGAFPWLPVAELARRLDREIATFPGGHLGYRTHAEEFAADLKRALGA